MKVRLIFLIALFFFYNMLPNREFIKYLYWEIKEIKIININA